MISVDLSPVKHNIVEALRQALEEVMPDLMIDYQFDTRNGYGHFRWNAICSKLRDSCDQIGWIQYGNCKRGSWVTPVLFHKASSYIITFMTAQTFKELQSSRRKGMHYLCGAASYNKNLIPSEEQLTMHIPSIDENDSNSILKSRNQLADSVNIDSENISGHVLIMFDTLNDKLLSVKAIRLTSELAISTEVEDWSNLIKKPFVANETTSINYFDEDDSVGLVVLK